MKYIPLFIVLLFIYYCKAQTTILPIGERDIPDDMNGIYFKDLDNELDKFEGTWIYQNGNTSLTIQLRKEEQVYNGEWYNDELLGEYKYVEDGVELINYLPRLNDSTLTAAQHSIDGNGVVFPLNTPQCDDCEPMEKRFLLHFSDFSRHYLNAEVLIQYIDDNGVEKMKVILNGTGTSIAPENSPTVITVPYGEYILTKQ